MEASYRGHLDAVKKLKEFGAQWSPRDNAGMTALHWAVDGGHVNVVEYILQEGVSVSGCVHVRTVEHSYNKPEIPGQTICYKQEFVISEQFPMRYCSTWLRSLLCYIKKFVIENFVIRVFYCIWLGSSCVFSC